MKPLAWLKANHQVITAIGAMLVGLAALFIAWRQTGVMVAQESVMKAQEEVMLAQQHGAVFPALQVDGFVSSDGESRRIGIRVSNAGVGPALIDQVVLLRDEAAFTGFSPVTDLLPDEVGLNWSTMIGRVLAPGESVTPMEFVWREEALPPEALAALQAEWGRWDMTVCYCSVFDRCWMGDTRGVGRRPAPVETCEIPREDLFEQLAETHANSESR